MGDKLSYRSFYLGFMLHHSKMILAMIYFTVNRDVNTLEFPKSVLWPSSDVVPQPCRTKFRNLN